MGKTRKGNCWDWPELAVVSRETLESGECCAQPSGCQGWCVSSSAPEDLLLPPAFAPKPKPISNLLDEISTHEIQQFQCLPSLPDALCHLTGVFSCLRCYFFFPFFPRVNATEADTIHFGLEWLNCISFSHWDAWWLFFKHSIAKT